MTSLGELVHYVFHSLWPHDEIMESSDRVLREHMKATQESSDTRADVEASTDELRKSILVARLRTRSFAEFEQSLLHREHRDV